VFHDNDMAFDFQHTRPILWDGYDFQAPSNYSSVLQNIVSLIGFFCKRDL